MNKKYEQLKKVIQKAVPEIMELKMGCEVDVGWTTEPRQPHYVTVLRQLRSNTYAICNHLRNTDYRNEVKQIIEYKDNFDIRRAPLEEIFEILGRPIRLADVLYAIEQEYEDDENGITRATGDIPEIRGILGYWQFSRDNNLDNQSDECKEFLIKLLIK